MCAIIACVCVCVGGWGDFARIKLYTASSEAKVGQSIARKLPCLSSYTILTQKIKKLFDMLMYKFLVLAIK